MKRNIGLGLAMWILALLVAACGRGGEATPPPVVDALGSPLVTPGAVAPESLMVMPPSTYNESVYGYLETLDPTGATVSFWYAYPDTRQFQMQTLVDEFNAVNSWGITVQAQPYPASELLYQDIITGISKLRYPAVALVDAYQVPSYVAWGALVELSPYGESPTWGGWAAADDFSPAGQAALVMPQVKAQYSWPWASTANVLLYNVDWLRELGYPAPPTSWEEFKQVVCMAPRRPFSRATGAGAATGLLYDTEVDTFIALTRNGGGRLVSETVTIAAFAASPAVEALNTLRDLSRQRCAERFPDEFAGPEAFGTGRVLFALASIHELAAYRAMQDPNANFTWGVTQLPYSVSQPSLNTSGKNFVLFNVQPEAQLAAWLFVQWLGELEQQAWWLRAANEIPAQQLARQLMPEYLAENPQYAEALTLAFASPAEDEPALVGYPACRTALVEALTAIERGAVIQTTLEAAQATCTALLEAAAP